MTPLKIVIAPDSFKESLSATEVAESIQKGIVSAIPSASIVKVPMADGGEGTVQSLVQSTGGRIIQTQVHDPLMRKITSFFGVLGDKQTAVIEMAAASGIELIPAYERNPLKTNSYGTGELIKSALDTGAKKLIIGIGGSATNDGGVGMLQALGIRFLDNNGFEIGPGGGSLDKLKDIDITKIDTRLKSTKIVVASDVNNPLFGENGASSIFGPQKGASPEMVKRLDNNLTHFARITEKFLKKQFHSTPGAGAAGGLGFGLIAWLNAEIKPGFEIIAKQAGLEEKIRESDLVITGEGKIDAQSKFGKTPYGVAMLAKKYQVPVLAFAGIVEDEARKTYHDLFQMIIPIAEKTMSLEESKKNAAPLLQKAASIAIKQYIQDNK